LPFVAIRIPADLHRRRTLEAAQAGVSLNRLAADKLNRAKSSGM